MDRTIKQITTAGVIAAVYVLLGIVFAPISFAVYQVRIAEALTILPFLTRAAVPGLFVGCAVANVYGGQGWQDIVFGSLLTLLAAILTHLVKKLPRDKWKYVLAPLPPVAINALGVSAYLAPMIDMDYWFAVQMIAVGQLVACYGLGLPLLVLLEKRRVFDRSWAK